MKRFLDFLFNYRNQIEAFLVTLVFLAASCGGIIYINRMLSLPNDHPAEQMLEEVLCEELDICLDLSPEE